MYRLETARLHLRPLTMEDLNVHHEIVGSDPQVTWNGKALTLDESRASLERKIQHWEEHGFGMWAIVDKQKGNLLGHAGLQRLEDTDQVEIGYYLGRPAWGKGVATEAGAASLRFGFEVLKLPQIAAVVRPENSASQNVLTKLGLQYIRDAHHYGLDVPYWRILQHEFQPADGLFEVQKI